MVLEINYSRLINTIISIILAVLLLKLLMLFIMITKGMSIIILLALVIRFIIAYKQ